MPTRRSILDGLNLNTNTVDDFTNRLLSGDGLVEGLTPDTEPSMLRVEDGDTIINDELGVSYRLSGFDTPETKHGTEYPDKAYRIQDQSGISVEEQNLRGQEATNRVQELIDSGMITTESLISNTTGTDKYGRVLSKDDSITDIMVGENLAVPWDKYDIKNQDVYRRYQEKKYRLTGSNDPLAENMRDHALEYADDMDLLDSLNNYAKLGASSVARAGAGAINFVLDATLGTANRIVGTAVNNTFGEGTMNDSNDIKFMNDYADKKYMYKAFGVNRRESDFARADILMDWYSGNKSTAVLKSLAEAPDTLIDSSGDIALTFIPFVGVAQKANATTNLAKVSYALKRNGGFLLQSGSIADTLLSERANNNDTKDISFQEAMAVGIDSLFITAIDRWAFSKSISPELKDGVRSIFAPTTAIARTGSGKALTKEEIASLEYIAPYSVRTSHSASMLSNVLSSIGSIVGYATLASAREATQEIVQTTGEVLAREYGTDKFGTTPVLARENNIREITLAGLLGAGAGGAVHSTTSGVGQAFYVGNGLHKHVSNVVARNEFYASISHLSPTEYQNVKDTIEADLHASKEFLYANSKVKDEIDNATDENGNLDFSKLTTSEAKTTVLHATKMKIQKYFDNNTDAIDPMRDKVVKHYIDSLISIVADGTTDINNGSVFNNAIDKLVDLSTELKQFQGKFQNGKKTNPLVVATKTFLTDIHSGAFSDPKAELTAFVQKLSDVMTNEESKEVAFPKKFLVDTVTYSTVTTPKGQTPKFSVGVDSKQSISNTVGSLQSLAYAAYKKLSIMSEALKYKEYLPSAISKQSTPNLQTTALTLRKKINESDGSNNKIYEATLEHIEDTLKFRDKVYDELGFKTKESKSNTLNGKVREAMTDAITIAKGKAVQGTPNNLLTNPTHIKETLTDILYRNLVLDKENAAVVKEYLSVIDEHEDVKIQKLVQLVREHIGNSDDKIIVDRLQTGDTSSYYESIADLNGTFDDVVFDEIEMTTDQALDLVNKLGLSSVIC